MKYFDAESTLSKSILEQNKELSKVEAVEVAKELGCTRIVDLGDVFVPCSSIEEYDYALKIYNLKEKIQSEQRDNLISSLLICFKLFNEEKSSSIILFVIVGKLDFTILFLKIYLVNSDLITSNENLSLIFINLRGSKLYSGSLVKSNSKSLQSGSRCRFFHSRWRFS